MTIKFYSNRTYITHEAECESKRGLYNYSHWLCRFYANELQYVGEWVVSINGQVVCNGLDIDAIGFALSRI